VVAAVSETRWRHNDAQQEWELRDPLDVVWVVVTDKLLIHPDPAALAMSIWCRVGSVPPPLVPCLAGRSR
jgi:hypothetical protein